MDTDIFEILQKKEFIGHQIEGVKERNYGYFGLDYHCHIISFNFELLHL